jgi:hypothetical protein
VDQELVFGNYCKPNEDNTINNTINTTFDQAPLSLGDDDGVSSTATTLDFCNVHSADAAEPSDAIAETEAINVYVFLFVCII